MSSDSPVYLLDSNVLIALTTPDHTAHTQARAWFGDGKQFATCPITQGALIRFHMRWAATPSITSAKALLGQICALPMHEFWSDDVTYLDLPERGICVHRQIAVAYLASLAQAHHGLLATMDKALAAIRPDLTFLL